MAGKKGFAGVFSYSSDSGSTYVPVANVTKIRPFAAKADSIDISAMDSASGYREKIAGMLDAGQASVDLNYDDKGTTHKFLLTNLGVQLMFKVTFPGSSPTTAVWTGFINGVGPEIPFDNKMTATISVEISGPVTIT